MKRFAFTIALIFTLVGSAYAQSGPNPADNNDLWDGYSFSEKMSGLETAKGTEDFEDDVIWGRSITLAGMSGEFTANLHRAGVQISTDYGNRVVGGTWTLHLYKGGQLRGMLFGEFTGGIIQWITDRRGNIISETVDASMVITGGTGEFADKGGPLTTGVMTSVTDVPEKGFPQHNGSISLNF